MKRVFLMATLLAMTLFSASAQEKEKRCIQLPSWLDNLKLSGYGMTQYQYIGQEGAKSNTFNIRMARIALEGRIAGDFYWKTQIQFKWQHIQLGQQSKNG